MTTFEITMSAIAFITLIAIWRAPIQAVKVGQKLQAKDREHQNKFAVFATIIGYRYAMGNMQEFVIATNQIPVVFNKDKNILLAYEKFIESHKKTDNKATKDCLNDLIVSMGLSLGYPEMNNQWISNYFYPEAASLEFDARYQQNLERVRRPVMPHQFPSDAQLVESSH